MARHLDACGITILGNVRLSTNKPNHKRYMLPDEKHVYNIRVVGDLEFHSIFNVETRKYITFQHPTTGEVLKAFSFSTTHQRRDQISMYAQELAYRKYGKTFTVIKDMVDGLLSTNSQRSGNI